MKHLCIQSSHDHPTLAYAAHECRRFLEQTTPLDITEDVPRADCLVTLRVDPDLSDTRYAVRVAHDAHTAIELAGNDEACVLHALYEMLEQAGIHFDVLGPRLPDSIELADLPAGETVITPAVKRRGIRQHINFSMDISSYPLAEALEYIRNLARMRMNHMTFHSYSGQWFGFPKDGEYQHGGNFFYGTRHELPDSEPYTRVIRNKAVYCIPEVEPVIDQPEERSRAATEWLNAVMAECKRVGMTVQLSIEPPGETHSEGIAICREVMELYPLIDTLELITPECGDSSRTLSVEELKHYLVELFGEGVLGKPTLDSLKPGLEQLEGGLRHCARNIRLATELQSTTPDGPALVIGAYITCPDSLRILHALLERYTPAGIMLAFLPAHGARRSVANLRQMGFTQESICRSILYSWLEFDGNMYLQQNSVTGARQLLAFAQEAGGAGQVEAIALNHWRTAENRICIAYAAHALLHGPTDPYAFYLKYAAAYGIGGADRFAGIMQELDDLDDLAREKMFNIGFCVNGCWIRPGLRWTRQWNDASIDQCRRRFGALLDELTDCLESATTPEGRQILRFLRNRVECSIYQLDCAQAMKSLASFCDHDHPDALTDEQKAVVIQTCERAHAAAERYLAKHAEAIVDRGCEGTLINYYGTMPAFIDHIRAVFVEGETECPHLLPQFDEPPPPTRV